MASNPTSPSTTGGIPTREQSAMLSSIGGASTDELLVPNNSIMTAPHLYSGSFGGGEASVPNNSLAMGAGAPIMGPDGLVAALQRTPQHHHAQHSDAFVSFGGASGESPSVPNNSMATLRMVPSASGMLIGGANASHDSLASSYDDRLVPNNSNVPSLLGVSPSSALLAKQRTGSLLQVGGDSPLLVPNNSIVGNITQHFVSSGRNKSMDSVMGASCEGLVPNNSMVANTSANSGAAASHEACAALPDSLRHSMLYGCFARPPSRSVDTTEVEQCFAAFEPSEAKPSVVQWGRIVAAMGHTERERHGTMFPHETSTLTLERFMDFVEAVSRNR